MEISVIIPTYKPGDYIRECLDSVLEQSLMEDMYEVLIVLNGCGQPYKGQIEEYMESKANGRNIRLIHTEEAGVSNARNLGLDAAEGRYITFIDDDDRISPSYLEELYAKADEQTIVLPYTYAFNDGEEDTQLYNRLSELHHELAPSGRQDYIRARRFFFSSCQKLIPSDIIKDRRFNRKFRIGEDCIFMFLISDRVRYVDFTSENAIYYRRIREGSAITTQARSGRWKIFWNDIRMMAGYTRIYLSGLRRYSFHFYLTRMRGAMHFLPGRK